MLKIITLLTLNLLFNLSCVGQQTKARAAGNHAVLITKTVVTKSTQGNEREITKTLYTSTASGDQYFAYTLANGSITEATNYILNTTKSGLFLITSRLFSSQHETDSLRIRFNDTDHLVIVDNADQYELFPASYTVFKHQVNEKHNILVLLKLLKDNIGSYPIESMLPLIVVSKPDAIDKQIKQASITTARNQSDEIKDAWTCTYRYDKAGKIISVKAVADDQVRFYKTLTYLSGNIAIKTHRNIEDRQITDRVMNYNPKNTASIRWTDKVVETGKNLETSSVTTLVKRNFKVVNKANMSQQEVLKLINQVK
ncbi:MAG: hypothetical protein WKF66_16125 [Pedobacter sp.]